MRPTPDTLKLPAVLASELGITVSQGALGKRRSQNNPVAARKDRRKAERDEKKGGSRGGPPPKRQKIEHSRPAPVKKVIQKSYTKPAESDNIIATKAGKVATPKPEPAPKSILKKSKKSDPDLSPKNGIRSPSPPPRVSQAVKDKLDDDDAEIAFLEKKLGIKSRKLPQSFTEDGLDDLLSGLDALDGDSDGEAGEMKKKRKENDDWLAEKRKKALKSKTQANLDSDDDEEGGGSDEEDEEDDDDESVLSGMSMDGVAYPDDEDDDFDDPEDAQPILDNEESSDDAFSGFDSEVESSEPAPRVRENPYVAPKVAGSENGAPAKYIPPSMRKPTSSDSEDLTRLRRQTQGLVNRLTEANLISILGDIEKLYRDNARQHVTSTLVELLLTSVTEPTSLPDTLIILPAGFIAAVYKIIGTDFGAQIIQRIVELFDEHHTQAAKASNDGSENTKETSNLITLLSELYNFQVVGSNLIFDYIRLFLSNLSEFHAELLLKVVRTSGPQLRQDDPSSLKDIVAMLRPAVAEIGEANISVRTKFMIETINDLKNNKMKTGAVASAVVSEHTVRMKKTLGSLNNRNIKGSEPLRIGLKDIQDSDKKGKWWLVGASWAGNEKSGTGNGSDLAGSTPSSGLKKPKVIVPDLDNDGSVDLYQLALAHRMNTDIRRSIFVTLLSAADFSDAHVRLLKLRLKKSQELEIPKVIIYCCGMEENYNHYYTLVAKKLCSDDRKLRIAFQFGLWDLFKRMGENNDDEGGEDSDDEDGGREKMELRQVVNFAKMYGNLVASNALSLTILKNLNLSYLQEKTKIFVEIMLITTFLEIVRVAGKIGGEEKELEKKKALLEAIDKVKGMTGLVQGLLYFLRKVVKKTDVAGGKEETKVVKWASKLVAARLEKMVMEGGVAED